MVLAGGGATALGGLGGAAVDSAGAGAFADNVAGDVVDSLSGRDLGTRESESRSSAKRGKSDEAWSKMGLKQLKKAAEHDIKCLAASTGKVQEFFLRTPCTSLDRLVLAVGDGHGNAAIMSVVWVGFRTSADVDAFERVERIQGSGDVKPLGSALLGLANLRFSGLHYHSRSEKNTIEIAETENATGHMSTPVLDALADISSYLPRL
ncbi:MAG: hypothetical protein JWQ81_1638 [Amycolatopsis sp.]|nr:hypothetical protein [Amycolatopsis sp.]